MNYSQKKEIFKKLLENLKNYLKNKSQFVMKKEFKRNLLEVKKDLNTSKTKYK